jgi:septum formation protein
MMIHIEKPLLLASASPRRQELMQRAGIPYKVLVKQVDESYPNGMEGAAVASHITQKKAAAYEHEVGLGETVITADTIVLVEGRVLGKPSDKYMALDMLQSLSDKSHEVITAVCIRNNRVDTCFESITSVRFRKLETAEMTYYIDHYKPFDKAGGYGIQEWIGHIGIVSITGSYDNVVGLPVEALWRELGQLQKAGLL